MSSANEKDEPNRFGWNRSMPWPIKASNEFCLKCGGSVGPNGRQQLVIDEKANEWRRLCGNCIQVEIIKH
jgi:hypothetical protein